MAFFNLNGILPKNVLDRVEPVLNGRGRTALAAGAALAATVIITATLWLWGSSYSVLYAGLSGEEGGRTIGELQKLNIPYRINEGGRVILVPEADVGRARLQLAARGVPKQGIDQWALLDNESLGVSPFVEQVHYVRAIEAALSRTVAEVDGVASATVKLALPKQTDFLADAPKPSASVMVRLRPGLQLTTPQIDGLVGLVAASVAGLTRENVTIIDQGGKILNRNVKDALQQLPQQLEIAREVARRYEASLTDLLIPVLGRDNFRVSADADIDFSQGKESSVKYGDSHVLSQDETVHNPSSNGQPALGIPGALSNRPPETPTVSPSTQTTQPPVATPPSLPAATTPDKPEPPPVAPPDTHRTTNYDIDRIVQFQERPSWKLRAINVAVLVNNPSGNPLAVERIRAIDTLVSSAIGVGETRHVTAVDVPFAQDGAEAGETSRTWWREPWMVIVGQNTMMALAGLLVLFGGVFPLLRRVGVMRAAIAQDAAGKPSAPGDKGRPRSEPTWKPLSVSPDGFAIGAETVRTLVANDPARTAQVIKEWIARDRTSLRQVG